MPAELDNMNPEMDMPSAETSPEMDQTQGDVIGTHGETDREGAMAKADLYKLANYAHKLYQQVHDEDQLEAWVQAKITKAADYIASVYHYLEYEMKFSEYGHHLDNSDTLSEGQRMRIKEMLAEAKDKMKDLKKSQAEKMKEKKVDEGILSGGHKDCEACGGTGQVYEEPKAVPHHVKTKADKYKRLVNATKAAHKRMDNKDGHMSPETKVDEEFTDKSKTGDTFKTRTGTATKTDTGMKHTNTSYHDDGDADEKSGKGIKSHAKAQSAAEKKEKAPAQKFSPKSAKTYGMKDGAKFDNRDKVDEAKKKGDGNLANNYPPFDKVTKGDVVAGRLGKDQKGGKKVVKESMASHEKAHYHACKCAECYMEGNLEMAMHHKDMCEQHGGTVHMAQGQCHHSHPHINGGAMYECGGTMMYESKQGDHKKPCPPMSHIKKMCQAGKSVSEICKMHPDCDHAQLKKMVADCKKKLDEAAKYRDPKYKDKLYTQEPRDPHDDYHDADYYNPKPDDYPGAKHVIGGGEFDHNDPLRKGYGRHGTGSMNTHGKRKGMPSRDHISSLKGSIKSAHGTHPQPNLPEGAKPSAGLSKAKKSAVVKDAKAGKDIGKPGKSFEKVAKSAGGGEKGEKIAAAAMWKNMKETVAYVAEKKAMDKKMGKEKETDEGGNAFVGALKKAREEGDTTMTVDGKSVPVKPGKPIPESTDLRRLQELTGRLNRTEKPALVENREVDQIRALTQRLLG